MERSKPKQLKPLVASHPPKKLKPKVPPASPKRFPPKNYKKLLQIKPNLVTSMDVAYKGLNRAGAVPSLAYRKAISEFMEKYKGRKPKTPDELIEVDLRQKEILEKMILSETTRSFSCIFSETSFAKAPTSLILSNNLFSDDKKIQPNKKKAITRLNKKLIFNNIIFLFTNL